jgi:sulfur carrier protein
MATTLFINGKEHPLPRSASVGSVLEALGLAGSPVAVELNGNLVRRAARDTTLLSPGDRMEIVSFVGGG